MKLFVLLILAVFASENKENAVNGPENGEKIGNNSILVKIEEEDYVKLNKKSKFFGVCYHKRSSKWRAQRWSKSEKRDVSNGYYDDDETAAHASDTLARKLMQNGNQKLKLNFPDDNIEVYPDEKRSKFIGVSYNEKTFSSIYIGVTHKKINATWKAQRWNKNENKNVSNGHYDDEETAAHASDALAIKLMENGNQKLKLNFPDNYTEDYPKTKALTTSKYIGVTYNKNMSKSKWRVQRWSKYENTMVYNGGYDDQDTAAHASDTLARKLMRSGEQKLKLNFPDDRTEVFPEEKSKYTGVFYIKNKSKWSAQRWSKNENKVVYKGRYDDEETAAHASDTLAKKIMQNGAQKLKLNFPEDHTEVYPENQRKRKRSNDLGLEHPQSN